MLSQVILLQVLSLKHRTYKIFVKVIDKTDKVFKYLILKFTTLVSAKMKVDVLFGTQIRKLLRESKFDSALHSKDKTAWEAFKLVAINLETRNRELQRVCSKPHQIYGM